MAKSAGYTHRPAKASARAEFWAEARRRTIRRGIRLKDAVCMFLAGEETLDAKEAVHSGFSKHNLVAVDLSSKAVLSARNKGILAIKADIIDTILCWGSPNIDVLALDFTHGVTRDLYNKIVSIIYSGSLSNFATIYINLQRGRDIIRRGHSGWIERNRYVASLVGRAYQIAHEIHDFKNFSDMLSLKAIEYRDTVCMDGLVFDYIPVCTGIKPKPVDQSVIYKTRAAKALRTQKLNRLIQKKAA